MKGGSYEMLPIYRFLIILGAGLLFFVMTGDVSVAFLLVILLSYLEFRKKSNSPYH